MTEARMAKQSGEILLDMRGISKSYPGVQALEDADFSVRRGEIHGLVGKNGAGKSTLMGVLMGIRDADSGSVAMDGRNWWTPARRPCSTPASLTCRSISIC